MHLSRFGPIVAALAFTACAGERFPVAERVDGGVTVGAVGGGQKETCREFTSKVTVGGQDQETVGTACLQPDGRWRIIAPTIAGQPQSGTTDTATTYRYAPGYYAPGYYGPGYRDPFWYGPRIGFGTSFFFGHRHCRHRWC